MYLREGRDGARRLGVSGPRGKRVVREEEGRGAKKKRTNTRKKGGFEPKTRNKEKVDVASLKMPESQESSPETAERRTREFS